MLNGTITRSPGLRFCTEDPTSCTTPMNSWPKVVPTRVSGIMPWYRCRSDPQIAASVTRTMASLGCSMRGMSFSSTRTLYGPRYTIAFIQAPDVRVSYPRFLPGHLQRKPIQLTPEHPFIGPNTPCDRCSSGQRVFERYFIPAGSQHLS